MSHSTGLEWKKNYKVSFENDEYVVSFFRLYDYYYEPMSDSYEPTCEALDEYEVTVTKWRDDFHNKNFKVADHLSESARTGSIDKDTANMIYWNLKNRNISFETCKKFFAQIAGKELTVIA